MSARIFGWKSVVAVVAVGLLSIPLSLVIFKPRLPQGAPLPGSVVPFLAGMKVFEGLALGAGIVFFVFGYRLLKRSRNSSALTLAAYLSIGWCLISWWPHDNFHLRNGDSLWGAIAIDYGFHVTVMIATVVVALFFYRALQGPDRRST